MKSYLNICLLFVFFLNLFLIGDSLSPLLQATQSNDYDKIVSILKSTNNKDINVKGNGGQTPLMASVLSGNFFSVKALLEAGADKTIGENDGYTPIHGAGFQGRAEIAQLLIDHGVDPSDMHSDGYTAIHRSCWGSELRHKETIEVLLKNGVQKDEKSKDGKTCKTMVKRNFKSYEIFHPKKKSKKEEL